MSKIEVTQTSSKISIDETSMKRIMNFVLCVTLLNSVAQGQQPAVPPFTASSILPASILQTDTYRIANAVSVHEHQFQFNIETRYGTFPVTGIPLLEKRLSELRAIEQASRKLAASLGVDSETRNPVLHQLLVQLAARETVGHSATKFALSAVVPGLGTVASMEDIREIVATRSPHELLIQMDAELTQMGTWGPVKDGFVRSTNWTLLEKLTFTQSYKQLAGVEHSDLLLYLANQDSTEADILRRLIEVRVMAELHARNQIKSLSDAGLPIAWLRDGQIVGVCSIDYLTNSAKVQQVASGFRKSNPNQSISLLSAGWVSPEAQKTLDDNRISFVRPDFAANAQIGNQ